MHDGSTKKVKREPEIPEPNAYLAAHRVAIVTLAGLTAGNEYELARERTSIGRGPGVDLAFDDTTMSREHATFELIDGAIRLRDLGSTNGVLVNGAPTLNAELKHGDRIELGEHKFQLVIEARRRAPKTYAVDDA